MYVFCDYYYIGDRTKYATKKNNYIETCRTLTCILNKCNLFHETTITITNSLFRHMKFTTVFYYNFFQ